jgi:hypothetical protein
MLRRLTRNIAVTPLVGVSGVHHDLACEERSEIAREIGNRFERDRQHHDVAERCRVARRSGRRAIAELVDERLQLIGVTRGKFNVVSRFSPELRERGSNHAGADDANPHLKSQMVRLEPDAQRAIIDYMLKDAPIVIYEWGNGSWIYLYPSAGAGTSKASQAFWQVKDLEAEVAQLNDSGIAIRSG